MQTTPKQAAEMVSGFLKAKLVPLLAGSPGIGKSAIIHQVAKEYNLKVIDVRLAQCDPCDLNGFPTVLGKKSGYLPMDTFPIEGDILPEGYNGWLIFFDELTSAVPAVQSAAYKVILDRMIGNYHLHKNVVMAAAGNLETDNAIVQPMSTALQSRLVHIELTLDHEEWCDWAMSNNINHHITSFIKFKPSALYTFQPDHTDHTYACPRTWEFTDRIMKVVSTDSRNLLPMLAGTISEGVAREFVTFMKIYDKLPTLEAILKNPQNIEVPEEPSILYALSGSLATHVDEDNFATILSYIKRMPAEFQIITLREVQKRGTVTIKHPEFRKWSLEAANTLF